MDNKVAKGGADQSTKRSRKLSEYGKQLEEKQKVKHMYGLRERQLSAFLTLQIKVLKVCQGKIY